MTNVGEKGYKSFKLVDFGNETINQIHSIIGGIACPKLYHPGDVLREEFIEPRGMSRREFAGKIGGNHTRFNQIVNEYRSITTDTALWLSKALGTTTEF